MAAVNLAKIYKIFHKIDLDSIKTLQEWKLIPEDIVCPVCSTNLVLAPDVSCIDGWYWRCCGMFSKNKRKKTRCLFKQGLRKNTFFARSKLSISQILGFVNLWVWKVQLTAICVQIEITPKSAVDWSSFCREVLLSTFLQNPQKLGGPGKIVEIDESKFGKRKYHRGHRVEGQWVFGGFERGTGRVFMVTVEKRDSDTLLPIIENFIEKGTTIHSDCWKAYNCLSAHGYEHLTVNHSIHFKDPDTGVHTNSIESSWRHAKSVVLSNGRKKAHIPGNLAKYMFFKKCKELQLDTTIEFCKLAGNLYDPRKPQNLGDDEEEYTSDEEELEDDL